MASRVSKVAEPIRSVATTLSSFSKGEVSSSGSRSNNIQPGSADLTLLQGVDQRRFVHHFASGDIDKNALAAHH